MAGYAADAERLRLDLEAYRQQLGDCPIALALRPSPPDCDTPENLAAKVRLARDLGVARLGFYHYGFVRLGALDWIRTAVSCTAGRPVDRRRSGVGLAADAGDRPRSPEAKG